MKHLMAEPFTVPKVNAPGTYAGVALADLSDKRLALARTDTLNAIARIEAAPANVQEDKAEYLARMKALLQAIDAERARR